MAKSNFLLSCFFTIIFCLSLVNQTKCYDHQTCLINKNTALFVFGDSVFDVGNNNYIKTIGRANYWPYGETFFKYPTGRFSNGRIIPDFVSEHAKLPLIPPYLHPGFHDFTYGANFASAGAGALLETHKGFVIDLKTQLTYFKNVSQQLRQKLGDAEATILVSRAVYLITIGTNDYSVLFATNSTLLRSYSYQQFVGLVIGNITSLIKEIYKSGGRKFGFLTIEPSPCYPFSRVIAGDLNGDHHYKSCLDQITPYEQLHNKQLSELLQKLHQDLDGFKFSLSDFYTFLEERINYPAKYGFKEGKVACCGSGPYRGIFSCGGQRGVKEYELCDDVGEYVFFDSGHLTERIHQQFSEQAWSGKPGLKGSYNLKTLFQFE